jgi:hypothetical protein
MGKRKGGGVLTWEMVFEGRGCFRTRVGASKEGGGRFRKGRGWFMGGLAAFDVGVLGLAFWALCAGRSRVGRQRSGEWGWGAYLGLALSFPRGRPRPRLPNPSPFSSCAFGPAYAVSAAFVVVVGLTEAGDVAGGRWLSKPGGCSQALGGGQRSTWAEWAEGGGRTCVLLGQFVAVVRIGDPPTLPLFSSWLLGPICAAFVVLVGLADVCDVAGVRRAR